MCVSPGRVCGATMPHNSLLVGATCWRRYAFDQTTELWGEATMTIQSQQGVFYESVGTAYFEKRRLDKSAGLVLLWALGVGAVISGDFFGWNFGLAVGGFSGLAVATIFMAVMYTCMVYCIAELSTAMPHAGGFYSYARTAFGPWGGFLIGVTDTIEYVLTPAVIVVGIGNYLNALFPDIPVYVWWVSAYALSIAINIMGAHLTLRVGLIVTLLAIGILVYFYAGALMNGAFDWNLLFNIAPSPGHSKYLPNGWYGIFLSIPYAIWFFLAIEQIPLAAEEARDVPRDMPLALRFGIATLLVLALATLVINSGVGGGAHAMGLAAAPLIDGFGTFLGGGAASTVLSLIALSGLIASFHTIIYAYGRVLFSMSRAGYYPRWISITGSRTRTPHYALIIGGVIGLGAAWLMDRFSTTTVGATLLNMAVFGAVISYIGVMASYIKIKRERPEMHRPYTSPLGMTGAVVGVVLAGVALLATFAVPEYRPGVIGVAVTLGVALLYFAVYSSRRLVAQAPEEHNALSLEQRIIQLQTALGKVQDAKSHVEQILAARANAVRAVIHDLNHTVQGVQSAMDLWLMELRSIQGDADVIDTGYARLQVAINQQKNLLDEMRDAALLEGGNLVLRPEHTNIGALVHELEVQLHPRYNLAECELRIIVDPDIPHAWCDPRRMQRVIYNILENALRYTSCYRDDGVVLLTVTSDNEHVLCKVEDNGRGIAPDDLERLGEKFTRLAQGEGDPDGMGLGLNFAIGIMRLSSGSLTINSPGEGQGTIVTLHIPRAAEVGDVVAQPVSCLAQG